MSHSFNDKRHAFGHMAENHVASHLHNSGFTILERNYKRLQGEVDIIARNNEAVIFVEVKARTNDYFNTSEVVTLSKQRKVIKAAELFIMEKKLYNTIIRFDVALVKPAQGTFEITYIPNAFTKHEQ